MARFEAHLQGCQRCTGDVAERRRLKRSLATMPAVAPPRSFRITAEMVVGPSVRPPVPHIDRLALRLSMALAGLATVGLVSTVVGDVNNGNSHGTTPVAAPSTFQAASAEDSAGRPALGSSVAPLAAPSQAPPVTPIASGTLPLETPRSLDSGKKAVAPAAQAPSTGGHPLLRMVEVGFAFTAAASVAASVLLVRRQRRTSP